MSTQGNDNDSSGNSSNLTDENKPNTNQKSGAGKTNKKKGKKTKDKQKGLVITEHKPKNNDKYFEKTPIDIYSSVANYNKLVESAMLYASEKNQIKLSDSLDTDKRPFVKLDKNDFITVNVQGQLTDAQKIEYKSELDDYKTFKFVEHKMYTLTWDCCSQLVQNQY